MGRPKQYSVDHINSLCELYRVLCAAPTVLCVAHTVLCAAPTALCVGGTVLCAGPPGVAKIEFAQIKTITRGIDKSHKLTFSKAIGNVFRTPVGCALRCFVCQIEL